MKTCLKGAVIVPPYWGSLCSTFFFPEIAFYFWKAISGFFEKFLYPDFLVLFHFNRLTTRPQACETFTTLVLRLPAENDFQNSDRQNFQLKHFSSILTMKTCLKGAVIVPPRTFRLGKVWKARHRECLVKDVFRKLIKHDPWQITPYLYWTPMPFDHIHYT